MWWFTTRGFYSVVADKLVRGNVLIRARCKADIWNLYRSYHHRFTMTRPKADEKRDYRWRLRMKRKDFARLAAALAHEVTYYNFKDEVHCYHDQDNKAGPYMEVWSAIIKSIDTEGQNLNFAISSETIREAIASFKEWNKMGTPVEQQPGGLLIRPDPSGGYSLVPQATPTPTWEPPVTDRIMPTTPPGAVATPAPSTAESTDVFQIAFIAWKTGNYEMAISGFDETIQRWPRSARAWALRGDAQRHLKHYGNAIRDYTEAIRLSPGSDFSYEGRSKVFETLGDHVKAAQDLRKARELRKNK